MAREQAADIPFILVSGHIGEETAVEAMAVRTASDPSSDPMTGADLGSGQATAV